MGNSQHLSLEVEFDRFSQGYESDISFDGDDEDCQILSPYESESNPSTEDEDPRDVKKVNGNKLRLVHVGRNIWLTFIVLFECSMSGPR